MITLKLIKEAMKELDLTEEEARDFLIKLERANEELAKLRSK